MKVVRILAVAGAMAALACSSAAFAQANMIPMGAGAGVERQPPGSRFRNPTNRPPAAQPSTPSCSQQADVRGLHGRARKAFREKCRKNGGR